MHDQLAKKVNGMQILKNEIRLARLQGETLIVREIYGVKQLTDPQGDLVCLQSGRKACLVGYFQLPGSQGRDVVTRSRICEDGRIQFTAQGRLPIPVFLDDLRVGQQVDVLPEEDASQVAVYLPYPTPVLRGSALAVAA